MRRVCWCTGHIDSQLTEHRCSQLRDGAPSVVVMIRRLKFRRDGRRQRDRWFEEEPSHTGVELYVGRTPLRKIRIMVDAELLTSGTVSDEMSPRELMTDLLDHELVSTFRYADSGPPNTAVPNEHGAYSGWIVVDERSDSNSRGASFLSAPDTTTHASIRGNIADVAADDVRAPAYAEKSLVDAAIQRRADGTAAQVASQALGADLYITEREYLHVVDWDVAAGVTICRPDDALAALGLYLRAQGAFLVTRSISFNRGLFYWVATRELLPASWRWLSACVQHSTFSGTGDLSALGSTLLERVRCAVEARDRIHFSLNRPQNNDTHDSALLDLDVVLLMLMAAADVAARVVHLVLALPGDERRAAWQSDRWLENVRKLAPELSAVVAEATRGQAVLTVLRLLRNSVHGAALPSVAYLSGRGPQQSLVSLPARDRNELSVALDRLGGWRAWAAQVEDGDRFYLDPGVFADRLLREVINLLNQLMTLTPVEQLPGVNLSESDLRPTEDRISGASWSPFDEWVRANVRRQLGL